MKRILAILLFLAICVAMSFANGAQEGAKPAYPTKPITLIVGAKAGGGTDNLVRLIAPGLEKTLGQKINIVNKVGGSGTMGNLEVSNSAADGYTIGVLTDFETIGNLLSGADLGYNKDTIKFIGSINASTNILIVGAKFPGEKTVKGFVEYCKQNPGSVTIGTSAAAQRMVMQSLADAAGIKFTCVPFSGGPESFNNLLGGQVDASFIAPSFSAQAIANGCTPIACASYERFSLLPELPSFKESGFNTINNETTRIFFAPKDTPDYIIEILEKALKDATSSEDIKASLAKINEMYSYKTAAEARSSFEDKFASIKAVVDANPSILK